MRYDRIIKARAPAYAAILMAMSLLITSCALRGVAFGQEPAAAPFNFRPPPSTVFQPSAPETVTVGILGSAGDLGPYADSLGSAVVSRLVYSGLTRLDSNGVPVPDLAEFWEISEDRQTYTFYLKKNLAWHDGTAVEPDDVVFTLGALADPRFPFPEGDKWLGRRVTRTKERIEINLPAPCDTFLYDVTVPVLPKRVFADKRFEEWPSVRHKVESGKPLLWGSGPFVLMSCVREPGVTTLSFVRSETPGGKMPVIERLNVRFYSTREALLADLQAGKVEMAVFYPPDSDLEVMNPEVKVTAHPSQAFVGLVFNCSWMRGRIPSVFSDKALRQAVSHIAVDAMANLGDPVAVPVVSPFDLFKTLFREGFSALRPERAFESAAAALTAGGWQKSDGRWVLSGMPARFNLLIPTHDQLRFKVATKIAERLREFGISCTITQEEPQVFRSRIGPPFDYQAALVGWTFPVGGDLKELLHSSAVPRLDPATVKVTGGQNIMQYRSHEMDVALQSLYRAADALERESFASEVERLLLQDRPLCILYSFKITVAVNARLSGPAPLPFDLFNGVHEWSIRPRNH